MNLCKFYFIVVLIGILFFSYIIYIDSNPKQHYLKYNFKGIVIQKYNYREFQVIIDTFKVQRVGNKLDIDERYPCLLIQYEEDFNKLNIGDTVIKIKDSKKILVNNNYYIDLFNIDCYVKPPPGITVIK
mgnify:CR=1 FL=1|jgi:hypothetical protein